jgi:hypothetical protein
MTSSYANFPVHETIELREISDVRRAVDRMVDAYERQGPAGDFSYRILLPREEKSTSKAKKIGITFQGEFVYGIRKRNLLPKLREVRYLHDEGHYGWLLASPQVYERFEKGA